MRTIERFGRGWYVPAVGLWFNAWCERDPEPEHTAEIVFDKRLGDEAALWVDAVGFSVGARVMRMRLNMVKP